MSGKNYLPAYGRINLQNPNTQLVVDANKGKPIQYNQTINQNQSKTDVVLEESPKTESAPPSDNIVPPDDELRDTGRLSPKNIAIIAIISGVLVMGIGFVAYRYFSQADESQVTEAPIAEVQIEENQEDDYEGIVNDLEGRISSGVSTSRADEWANPDDYSGISALNSPRAPEAPQAPEPASPSSNEGMANQSSNTGNTQSQRADSSAQATTAWIANNYDDGDLNAGSYTVVRGDTLWEIAEGVYGNGSDWQKIAQTNNVSYLANGNPLILPGQILNIPT